MGLSQIISWQSTHLDVPVDVQQIVCSRWYNRGCSGVVAHPPWRFQLRTGTVILPTLLFRLLPPPLLRASVFRTLSILAAPITSESCNITLSLQDFTADHQPFTSLAFQPLSLSGYSIWSTGRLMLPYANLGTFRSCRHPHQLYILSPPPLCLPRIGSPGDAKIGWPALRVVHSGSYDAIISLWLDWVRKRSRECLKAWVNGKESDSWIPRHDYISLYMLSHQCFRIYMQIYEILDSHVCTYSNIGPCPNRV